MIGGRGVVLTSEGAIHENKDTFTHWTSNVYRYGTYADENRSYTKGHSENNLRQINTFFIDFDIHTAKETISTKRNLNANELKNAKPKELKLLRKKENSKGDNINLKKMIHV